MGDNDLVGAPQHWDLRSLLGHGSAECGCRMDYAYRRALA